MSYVISGRNINDLYPQALHFVNRDGVVEPSRAGEVKVVPFPVLTVTDKPMERVLFDQTRDANPFFHLFECLWMLHGESDARWLDRFVSDFSARFAEQETHETSEVDVGHIHGAYGRRWRAWFHEDQLHLTAKRLKVDPKDRRIVISMWDPISDLQYVEEKPFKDVPCNTHMYPRIVNGKLDLTVCVRSNDVIWGAYGANAVHMTFVQEYLAGLIGVPVGKFYQLSNNWHAYTEVLDRFMNSDALVHSSSSNLYVTGRVVAEPIMTNALTWDQDLVKFMENPDRPDFDNMWFYLVARPAWNAHVAYKEKRWEDAFEWCSLVEASDWSLAMHSWIARRYQKWAAKNA